MPHRDLHLTDESRDLLAAMPSKTFDDVIDYLNNPLLRAAADAGKPMHLATPGATSGTWMDLRLDQNAYVALSLWEADPEQFEKPPRPLSPEDFKIWPLPKGGGPRRSESFQRTRTVLAGLWQAARAAASIKDTGPYSEIIQTLGAYVPWVAQMQQLCDRLHAPDMAPHYFHLVQRQLGVYQTLHNGPQPDIASAAAAVHALLGMHASMHLETTPCLFALDTPGGLTSFLFVQQVQEGAMGDRIQDGSHVWLDASGTPIFYNDLKENPFFHAANLAGHRDPALAGLEWRPSNLAPHGHGYQDSWEEHMQEGFTPQSRALVEALAQATPRKLSPEEVCALTDTWVGTAPTLQSHWSQEYQHGRLPDPKKNEDPNRHKNLSPWAKHMADCWSVQFPTEHALLTDLMPPMTDVRSIDAWRVQMRAMTTPARNAAESFNVENLLAPTPEA